MFDTFNATYCTVCQKKARALLQLCVVTKLGSYFNRETSKWRRKDVSLSTYSTAILAARRTQTVMHNINRQ
jgi:hypothetical protein